MRNKMQMRVMAILLVFGMVFPAPLSAAAEENPETVAITGGTASLTETAGPVFEENGLDFVLSDTDEEESKAPEKDLMVEWRAETGTAYAILSLPYDDEAEDTVFLIPSELKLCKKQTETEEPDYSRTDEEVLYSLKGKEKPDGSVWFELPVYELDPDVYVLRSAQEQAFSVEREFHIVSVFDDAEGSAVLDVMEDTFYVPYEEQGGMKNDLEPGDAEEKENADGAGAEDADSEKPVGAEDPDSGKSVDAEDPNGAKSADIEDEAGEDENKQKEGETPKADDETSADASGENAEENAEKNAEENEEENTEKSLKESEENAEENKEENTEENPEEFTEEYGENGETDELLGEPTGISLYFSSYVSEHKLYVELAGGSDAKADVWFVMTGNSSYSGDLYGIKKLENCKNGDSIDLDSISAPAGKWYIYAVILKPEAEGDFRDIRVKLRTQTPMLFYVPTIPSPEFIQSATSGNNDGAFGLFYLSSNQYPELASKYGTPGSVKYGRADAPESSYTTTQPNMPANNLAAGDYRIRFQSQKLTNTLIPPVPGTMGVFAAASDYRTFVIPEKEPTVKNIRFTDGSDIVTNLEMYKGQTVMLPIRFEDEHGNTFKPGNTTVSYESSNPSKVSVDEAGNIQAKQIVLPADPVKITASCYDNGYIMTDLYVSVSVPLKIKMKKTSYTVNRTSAVTIEFTVPKNSLSDPNAISVTSSDPAVWNCGADAKANTLDPSTGNGTVVIPEDPYRVPGTTIVTVMTGAGEKAFCTVNFDGIYAPGTDAMLVYKGGKKQTGWIYLNAGKDEIVAKAKAQHTFCIDPVAGKPVNGIVRIGKDLYHFQNRELVTGKEGKTEYESGKYVFYGKDGRLLTGWQGPKGNQCYYDPDSGFMLTKTVLPCGSGLIYVRDDGSKAEDGYVEIGSGDSKKRYFVKNGVFKTGWIYLKGDANLESSKAEATRWLYADPASGEILYAEDAVITIGSKRYYIYKDKFNTEGIHHSTGYIDADKNSVFSVGDYYAKDGEILTNKKVTVEGETYYLDENGHPKTGMFYDGSKVIFTDGNGRECNDSLQAGFVLYRCGQNNDGSEMVYVTPGQGGVMKYQGSEEKVTEIWLRTKNAADKTKAGYYYIDKNGKFAKGFQTIDGNRYYFDESTGLLQVGKFNSWGIDTEKDIQIPVKGKYYLVDNKAVETGGFPGRIYYKDAGMKGKDNKPYTYWVDANGVCQTGWKT
ncbi:MAG: hypothetical protein K5886_00310, partial [Lachnospiraceae bacterium]|nr:hypothetical protein [Lachnospiraceae bacterium]